MASKKTIHRETSHRLRLEALEDRNLPGGNLLGLFDDLNTELSPLTAQTNYAPPPIPN